MAGTGPKLQLYTKNATHANFCLETVNQVSDVCPVIPLSTNASLISFI